MTVLETIQARHRVWQYLDKTIETDTDVTVHFFAFR